MSFIDCIKERLGSEIPCEPLYRAVLFGENCAYIENVLGIINLSSTNITLGLKKGSLEIIGENLYVKQYSNRDALICGKIVGVTRK